MDGANLILVEAMPLPNVLSEAGRVSVDSTEQQKIQGAKDFESVFIAKLLDAMKDSIVDWGLEKDGTSKQMDGLFWMYLGREIANQGGFGMWKDIYASLNNTTQAKTPVESAE